MSGVDNRPRRGCSLAAGLGCAVVLCIVVGLCGLLVGLTGLHFEYGPGVAVLEIRNEILDEETILADLEELVMNPDTKALVIRVDSPGGSITASEEVFNAVKRGG